MPQPKSSKSKISRKVPKKDVDTGSEQFNEEKKIKNNYETNDNPEEDDITVDNELDEDGEWNEDAEGDEGEGEGEEGEGGDEDCGYTSGRRSKGLKKISSNIDKDDDDDDDGADIIADENDLNPDLYVKPEERCSTPYLTLYEKVRLLGERTAQLAQGAMPRIIGVDGMDPYIIAQLELESKQIPMIVVRPLPNGKKEKWFLKELKLKKRFIKYGFTGGNVDKDAITKMANNYTKGGSITGYSNLLDTSSKLIEENDNLIKKENKTLKQKIKKT